MKWKKKAQAEPGKFLMWAIFVLLAGAVIFYLIWKWDSLAEYISSKFLI